MPARLAVLFTLVATLARANIITDENARLGTDRWKLRSTPSEEITGYVSATSSAVGETLRFFVSTNDPAFTLEIFRMGWYDGLGARRMTDATQLAGHAQTVPQPDPTTGLIRCQWDESYSLVIPSSWVSGVYFAKLTATTSGKQNYLIFVVRDERAADLVFQSPVTTYQAYNNWGGKSLYAMNSTGTQARKVSFDRPYSIASGASDFLFRAEYNMVRFLEREGFDVTYITNVDTHARLPLLRRAKAFLSVGHDEYWSWQMRDNVESARNAGVNLAFFSGNTCYWQVRFEDNERTIVAYKESALSSDPIATDGNPLNDYLTTTLWRNVPVLKPEESMIGVMYIEAPVDGDIVVDNASHWVFTGTNLQNGDHIKGVLGYEVDAIYGIASPPNLVRLAHSPYVSGNDTGFSDMTIYTAPSGALVFAAGTIQWAWGLDDYAPTSRGNRVSAAAQRMTKNVLNRMIGVSLMKRRAAR